MKIEELNTLIQLIGKRAERQENCNLVDTFVRIGPLYTALTNHENQIVYGRRGTGKTHLLSYLKSTRTDEGDIAILISMNQLGSSGGIYSDSSLPISERASRLLIDFLAKLQDELITLALDEKQSKKFCPSIFSDLDDLADAITEVNIDGTTEINQQMSKGLDNSSTLSAKIGHPLTANLGIEEASKSSEEESRSCTKTGTETHHLHFGRLNSVFERIANDL